MDKNPIATFFKFAVAFACIVGVSLGAYFLWTRVYSPEAKFLREQRENYANYEAQIADYEKAMREDAYGGETPQETLNLLIAALEKEDVELASKYFILNDVGERDPKWLEALQQKKEEGKIKEVVGWLKIAKLDDSASISEDQKVFASYQKGKVVLEASLYFNNFSKIWKILNIFNFLKT